MSDVNRFAEQLKEYLNIDVVGDIAWEKMSLKNIVYELHSIIDEQVKYYNDRSKNMGSNVKQYTYSELQDMLNETEKAFDVSLKFADEFNEFLKYKNVKEQYISFIKEKYSLEIPQKDKQQIKKSTIQKKHKSR